MRSCRLLYSGQSASHAAISGLQRRRLQFALWTYLYSLLGQGFCLSVSSQSTCLSTSFSNSRLLCGCSSSCYCRILQVLIRIGTTATIATLCIEGICRIFDTWLPIVIYTGHSELWQAKFERFVPSDMTIKGTSVSPTLSVDLTLISTWLFSSISPYQCLPPWVCSAHFSIEVFRWQIAVKATLWCVTEMLGIGWLPYPSSDAFDDISTAVFDRLLVIVIPSHILKSV